MIFILVISCGSKQELPVIKDLYIEVRNFEPELEECIMTYFIDELKIDSMTFDFGIDDETGELKSFRVAYRYKDASTLPNTNLLDGTRKFVITYIDKKDNIGNSQYQVESYKTEQSKWNRTANSMPTQLRSGNEEVLSMDEICNHIINSTHMYVYKFIP